MLEHLGERDAARRMQTAITTVIRRGEKVTYDLKQRRDDQPPSAPASSPTQ